MQTLSATGVCGLGLLCLLTISSATGQDSSGRLVVGDEEKLNSTILSSISGKGTGRFELPLLRSGSTLQKLRT